MDIFENDYTETQKDQFIQALNDQDILLQNPTVIEPAPILFTNKTSKFQQLINSGVVKVQGENFFFFLTLKFQDKYINSIWDTGNMYKLK